MYIKMAGGPLIQKKRYGNIHDYIIIFDEVPDEIKLPEFDKNVWVSIQINKDLDLKKFRDILKGFHTHRFYRNKKRHLFFNTIAKERLPVYNPVIRMHEHITVKLNVGGQKLKVKSTHGNSWRHLSGGVNCFEKPENAVRRELLEELGIKHDGKITFLSSKLMKINIPILEKPIMTKMYYYSIDLDNVPSININKEELSQVKIGNSFISA